MQIFWLMGREFVPELEIGSFVSHSVHLSKLTGQDTEPSVVPGAEARTL